MEVGSSVEEFTLPDQSGARRSLDEFLANGPVVLFFYPAAMTYGCTRESCHFRDLSAEFAQLGAQRLGISRDAVARQREFSERHGFDFPLLSDEAGEIAERFGVARRLPFLPVRRSTFVIGRDRRILAVIRSETRMSHHADEALEVLRRAAAGDS